MFLEKTSKKIKGYVRVKVYGFFIERFFNLALSENISLWDIKKEDSGTAVISVNSYDYKKIAIIAKKVGCKLSIEEKVGMPFFILKHKKRKIFAAFFLVIAICIYAYGLHIWNIEITGDFTFAIEDIKKELETENIKIGVRKNKLDIPRIKNNIYMRRHDIAWIGISLKGTNAIIEIVEGRLKDESNFDNTPCNIVADKEGMICKINVLEGQGMFKSGDMIKSGDILISGIMSSEWTNDRYVNAKGEVFIKTWYTDKLIFPVERDIISQTGNVEKKYSLKLENYEINLGNSDTNFEKYDTIISDNKLNLFGIYELPIGLKEITYREIDVDTIKYTESQAIATAKREIENNIIKEIGDSGEIVKKDIKTRVNKDNITVVVTIECIEKVGIKKKLEGF